MSAAEAPVRRHPCAAARGYSLIEAMVVTAVVALMSVALTQALQATRSADEYLKAVQMVSAKGQRTTQMIARLVSEARYAYEDDAVGRGYWLALDKARFPPATGVRLPILDTERDLQPDTAGDSRTGNALLLVREINGSPCVADKDTGKLRIIDTYRLVAVYPHQTQREVLRDGAPARDLVVWRGQAYPSLQQIREIADPDERESVVKDLVKRYGYTQAWDPRLDVSLAFFKIDGKGEIAKVPTVGIKLLEDVRLSEGPQLTHAGVQLAATKAGDVRRKPVLTAEDPGVWAPHGFEVKASGPSMARKYWLHLVVETGADAGRKVAAQVCTTIAYMHSF